MHARIGDRVVHPREGKPGVIMDILTNPACLLRTLVIQWDSREIGEWEEVTECGGRGIRNGGDVWIGRP